MRVSLYLTSWLLVFVAARAGALDPSNVAWSRLELEASKFFLTARSEVELAGRPAADALGDLLVPEDAKGLAPGGPESWRLDLRTRILSRDSRVRFWFDPRDARALQRSSHDVSKKRLRHRTYRYTEGGVVSRTLRPVGGEEDQPYATWSRREGKSFPFAPGDRPVTEAAALLYLIPAGDFHARGDHRRLRVFSRGRVREVDVEVAGKERISVDYVEVSPVGERAVDGEVEVLRVAVRPRAGEGEKETLKLLGLEGDIDIYLDPRTRAPLLISGKVDIAGRVNLRLKRAVLRSVSAR